MRISQGPLAISAGEAVASPADFSNSTWVFSGEVRIQDGSTTAEGDQAELRFRANALVSAVLRGKPARFTQARPAPDAPARGEAQELTYDLAGQRIQLDGNASLSDGTNEITGARIAYDLAREVVTAGAGEAGPVRMRITPPDRSQKSGGNTDAGEAAPPEQTPGPPP